jgi:hypothetical protein
MRSRVWIIGLFWGGVMAATSLSAYDAEDTINCNGTERDGIGGRLQIAGIAGFKVAQEVHTGAIKVQVNSGPRPQNLDLVLITAKPQRQPRPRDTA